MANEGNIDTCKLDPYRNKIFCTSRYYFMVFACGSPGSAPRLVVDEISFAVSSMTSAAALSELFACCPTHQPCVAHSEWAAHAICAAGWKLDGDSDVTSDGPAAGVQQPTNRPQRSPTLLGVPTPEVAHALFSLRLLLLPTPLLSSSPTPWQLSPLPPPQSCVHCLQGDSIGRLYEEPRTCLFHATSEHPGLFSRIE